MKSYDEWLNLNEFDMADPTTSQVKALQGNSIDADPQVISMLRPVMVKVQKLYPENREALNAVLAAAEHLIFGLSRHSTASQITKALGQQDEEI